jgi:leucyl aminopeptidase
MKLPAKNIGWFCLVLSAALLIGCRKDQEVSDLEDNSLGKNNKVALFADAVNSDSIQKNVTWLQGYKSRFFLHENRRQIALAIRDRFRMIGYQNARLDSFFLSVGYAGKGYSTWQYNVVARLEGKTSPGKVYLIGAHYDSYSPDPFVSAPGADDNASGVSAIVEIARVFKKQGFAPNGSIEFVAFAAEEIGLKGSADFAVKAAANKSNIAAMLNLDMISFAPDANPDSWVVNVMNYDNSAELQTRIATCGRLYSKLVFVNNNTNSKRGDSYSFFQNGFPAAFIISEFYSDPYYHTVNDVVEKYNYLYCREVVAVSCAFLVQENL